ncbi:MAG: hypothetical protein ACLPSF_15405 [Methylocella sp.]
MSEPVTTRRPLIAFDEGERRIGRPVTAQAEIAHVKEGMAFPDIIRFGGDPGESASAYEAAAEDFALNLPPAAHSPAPEPVIRGDFAAIEAALLGATRPGAAVAEPAESRKAPAWARFDLRASRADAEAPAPHFPVLSIEGADAPEYPALLPSEAGDAALYPDAGVSSDSFILFDDAAVSGSAAIADEDKRSRRPIYIMAALVLAGVAGITATSFRRDGAGEMAQVASKPVVIAPIAAESVPPPSSQSAQATGEMSAAAQAQQASLQQTSAQQASGVEGAPPAGAGAPNPPPVGAAADATPRVISLSEPVGAPSAAMALPAAPPPPSELATGSILAPPPPGKAQMLAEPSVKAAFGEAKKVKTAAVRPDGSLVKAEPPATTAPPQIALNKDHPAKPSLAKATAAVKTAAVKAAKVAHVTPPHPAVVATKQAKPAAVATAAKVKPATDQDAQPAPAPQAATERTPAPAPTGALAFVDTAVNSITGATGKLLDWGRTASSGAHN